jgi:hypothetical protein
MSEREWFAPKRYGIGAGLPIAWQGWVTLALFIAAITVAGITLLPVHWGLYVWALVVATAAITIVAARTTKGGWRWRWGEDE